MKDIFKEMIFMSWFMMSLFVTTIIIFADSYELLKILGLIFTHMSIYYLGKARVHEELSERSPLV